MLRKWGVCTCIDGVNRPDCNVSISDTWMDMSGGGYLDDDLYLTCKESNVNLGSAAPILDNDDSGGSWHVVHGKDSQHHVPIIDEKGRIVPEGSSPKKGLTGET